MLGVQVTPLIHIWDRLDHPLQVRLEPLELQRVVFDGTVGGSRFLATLGGYVATEESNPRPAARNLNSFLFALSLLRDHPNDPVGEDELDICREEPTQSTLQPSRGKLSRLGSAFAWYPEFHLQVARENWPRLCDAKVLPMVADLASGIASSQNEVAFYQAHAGLSAKHDGEPITTFVNFWILLEMLLAAEIRRYEQSRGTSNAVVDLQLARWNIPTKVRKLKKWNAIQPLGPGDPTAMSSVELDRIVALAPVRNRVVHSGYRPNLPEVDEAAALGWRAMWRFFRLSGISYQPYVEAADRIQIAFAKKHGLS